MNRTLDSLVLRYAGYGLIFLAAAYGVYLVRGALPIFLIAGLLAYALEPLLRRLETRGYSRRGAVGFVALMFVLVFVLGLSLLASAWQQAQSLANDFPRYQSQTESLIEVNRARIDKLRLPVNVKKTIQGAIDDFQESVPQNAREWLQRAVSWVIASLGAIGITMIVVPIITLYLMMEMNPIRARFLMLVPPPYRRDVTEIAGSINELLGRYVRGQMIVCSLFGLLCTVAFTVLGQVYGMQYTLVLGILAGLIYIVPYLGMATLALAAATTAYFTSVHSPLNCAVIAVMCCVVFNLVIDYGIAPRVLGKGVGLHPLLVIFALLSGAQVGGVLGMILAVPVFASLRVVAIYLFPQLIAPVEPMLSESHAPGSHTTSKIVAQTSAAEQSAEQAASQEALQENRTQESSTVAATSSGNAT